MYERFSQPPLEKQVADEERLEETSEIRAGEREEERAERVRRERERERGERGGEKRIVHGNDLFKSGATKPPTIN